MRRTSLIGILAILGFAGGAAAEDVLIKSRDGVSLSAIVQTPDAKSQTTLPALLVFDIYADPDEMRMQAEQFAARGYVGVVAAARGKYRGSGPVTPYEHDGADATAVLDWISRQPWSNGKVGMLGGSYSGFTAWAATKRRHPALKAIAVSAPAIPGQGLPMLNNVFLTANYGWTFYVTNNQTLDEATYTDRERWFRMAREWFASGRPYRELDQVDGTPNPLFQRWLTHPAFDSYWQAMVPYEGDFKRVDIPVLSITGYYDDAQVSTLEYFDRHTRLGRNPEHYLVLGPWDHFGTHASQKPEVLRDYPIDAAAQIDSQQLKLDFMDYVLQGKPRPALLQDRVNFEVMGANQWRRAPTLEAMHGIPMRLYFSEQKDGELFTLGNRAPPSTSKVVHEVDLADRVRFHNFHSYPGQIVRGPLEHVTESIFATTPFDSATTVLGSFRGELSVTINKRDFDLGITVFEAMPDGRLFHLAQGIQRASFAGSREKRRLLTPGQPAKVRFETTVVCRQMSPGSRLLVLVDAIKHPMAQINYGTGKDVSDESIKDAGEPLRIEIGSGSFIEVPLDNAIQRPAG